MKSALVSLLFACSAIAAPDRLIVHEWGTFTSFQDENGRAFPSINSDDEPLPPFVHELKYFQHLKPGDLPHPQQQGAPVAHPLVTMRLETPVIYFYPPKGATLPIVADVKVQFYSGWLTQFYPKAEAEPDPPYFNDRVPPWSHPGWLKWAGLKIGGDTQGPKTSEHVWTAPREVRAAAVTTPDGESEKFLFYRGVGQSDAPLSVSRSKSGDLVMRTDPDDRVSAPLPMTIQKLWLAEFRQDGNSAFRSLSPITLERESQAHGTGAKTPATFSESEFSTANLKRLQTSMHSALVEDGLYADEADALLKTWELSYFKSWGLRLFFLVPRAWTDYRLPIEISVPCDIKRVMVGRIELVTPEHRDLLRQLANAPVPTNAWARYETVDGKTVMKGDLPPIYRDLGRFRNALILDEEKQRPTRALSAFIEVNGLEASYDDRVYKGRFGRQ